MSKIYTKQPHHLHSEWLARVNTCAKGDSEECWKIALLFSKADKCLMSKNSYLILATACEDQFWFEDW